MKSFTEFFNNSFLVLESIEYTDRTLFRKIINEELTPTEDEVTKLDIELSNPETAKKYLDNDEELELIEIYKNDPNGETGLDARNKLIENKLKYIHLLASKAVSAGRIKSHQMQDAIQNAVIYLINGIDKFDPSKGVPFTAYAKQWIMAGITNPFNPARQRSISSDGAGKTDSQGNTMGIVSFDTPTTGEDSDDKAMTVGDNIADIRAGIDPTEALDDNEMQKRLNSYLGRLNEKEARAIKMRFYADTDGKVKTLEEIGEAIGMTKMGVKMLIDRAMAKLKTFAREDEQKKTSDEQTEEFKLDALTSDEMKARLGIFLKKLPAHESTALKLYFSKTPAGLPRSYSEIGEELGMSASAAKLLIDKLLNKLKIFAKEERF